MFNKIINNKYINILLKDDCEENKIEARICDNLIYEKEYLVIKVDDYYKLGFRVTGYKEMPPSVDCIILIKCKKEDTEKEFYDLYLVELKNIDKPKNFDKENIIGKFKTTINDFLNIKFKDSFDFNINNFNCYFISDPYRFKKKDAYKNITQKKYEKIIKSKGLRLDYFNSIRPFKYKNKISFIKPILPNPIIKSC